MQHINTKTGSTSRRPFKVLFLGFCAAFIAPTLLASTNPLDEAIAMPHRIEAAQRDNQRNPKATLEFFEVKPHHSVVEIWPGGGWYTQILAPYLRQNGELYAAHFNPESSVEFFTKSRTEFEAMIAAAPELYDETIVTTFDPPQLNAIAPPNSADRVLTFRNIHNWYMRGAGEAKLSAAFESFYTALKPGGLLGIVEHRLPESRPLSDQDESGYMKQSFVIAMAEAAGFKLIATSEINANAKDNANHPNGVWTLPPRLRIDDSLKAQYANIGESDRMTLKFQKPK